MISDVELDTFIGPYYKDKDIMHDMWHVELVSRQMKKIISAGCYDVNEEHLRLALAFHGFIYSHEQRVRDFLEEHGCSEREFDFTIAFAVLGQCRIGCFQVGDGAITVQRNNQCAVVFPPDKGEFDNQTSFLKTGDDRTGQFHAETLESDGVTGLAITSDGPEHLMFDLQTMTPGPIFSQLFSDLAIGQLTRQDILDYLTGSRWTRDPRGADDRSIAILALSQEGYSNELV